MEIKWNDPAFAAFSANGIEGSALSGQEPPLKPQPLEVKKYCLPGEYDRHEPLTCVVAMENTGRLPLFRLWIADNLGAYSTPEGSAAPLTYTGPALFYMNGCYVAELCPAGECAGSAAFCLDCLPAKGSAAIVYGVEANDNAPRAPGSAVTSEVVVTAEGLASPATALNTIRAAESRTDGSRAI